MGESREERYCRDLLGQAGILINGSSPFDVRVKNSSLYRRLYRTGSLGLGESYMDGWWECDELDEFFYRVLKSRINTLILPTLSSVWLPLRARITNLGKRSRAFQIGKHHYDIGNDLYQAMLGTTMTYSCGYWRQATTLDDAQVAKHELICQKLKLEPRMRVLDVGCGWGSFLRHAALRYGVYGVGITVSESQREYALKMLSLGAGTVPSQLRNILIDLLDYRDISGYYDRIVSVGMFEHVGYKNYETFMETMYQHLRPKGLFLLHTIGSNYSVKSIDPWINRYIFPNAMIPSAQQITRAAEGFFTIEDWHSFGPDYDVTLRAWWKNFDAHWPEFQERYGAPFYRMWRYYLHMCAGAFRARYLQLWQIIFSKVGEPLTYTSVR